MAGIFGSFRKISLHDTGSDVGILAQRLLKTGDIKYFDTIRTVYNGTIEQGVKNFEEIYVQARKEGIMELKNAGAVVLETTGDITIIPSFNYGKELPKTLNDVELHP